MASESVAVTTRAPGKGRESIRPDGNVALGLTGIIQVMERYTTRGGDAYNMLGGLTDVELVTLSNCVHNERDALITGLRTLGDLVSCFDTEKSDIDHNGVGWLVKSMAESLETLENLGWSAADELVTRGYRSSGTALTVEG